MFLYILNNNGIVLSVDDVGDAAYTLSEDKTSARMQSTYSIEHPIDGITKHVSDVSLNAPPGCTYFLSETYAPAGHTCLPTTGVFVPTAITYTKEHLLMHLASERWRLEVSGIEVNGYQIDTSRESQSKISAAYVLSQVEPDEDIKFKTKTGYVTLTSSEFSDIALTVARYVRDLYNLEEYLASRIKDGEITTLQEITDYMHL